MVSAAEEDSGRNRKRKRKRLERESEPPHGGVVEEAVGASASLWSWESVRKRKSGWWGLWFRVGVEGHHFHPCL